MSRDPGLFLQDIQEACDKILLLTDKLDRTAFSQDWRIRDATLHNLEVLGEAVKRLPEPMRAKRQDIPWKRIAGFRDVLAHAYFSLDDAILWDVIQHELRPLRDAAAWLLAELDSPKP